jgi:hypothetical protein
MAVRNPALACASWGLGSSAERSTREVERPLEAAVSSYLGKMTVLPLPLDDAPGRKSLRGYIERNAIALLGNFGRPATDRSSANWLGHCCPREKVRLSGLWNSDHVDEEYDPGFLSALDEIVEACNHGGEHQRTADPSCASGSPRPRRRRVVGSGRSAAKTTGEPIMPMARVARLCSPGDWLSREDRQLLAAQVRS